MSTPVELQRVKEQRLAASREALVKVIREHDADRMVCFDHDGLCCPAGDAHDYKSQYEHQADAILSSGVLVDADEVAKGQVHSAVARVLAPFARPGFHPHCLGDLACDECALAEQVLKALDLTWQQVDELVDEVVR